MTDRETLLQLQTGLVGLRVQVDGMIAVVNAQIGKPVDVPIDPPPPPPPAPPSGPSIPLALGAAQVPHRQTFQGGQAYSAAIPRVPGSFAMTVTPMTDQTHPVAIGIVLSPSSGGIPALTDSAGWAKVKAEKRGDIFGVESAGIDWTSPGGAPWLPQVPPGWFINVLTNVTVEMDFNWK